MTTRQKTGSDFGIQSGYGNLAIEEEFKIPACTIEDVDKSLFKIFDTEIGFQIETEKDGLTKIPVIFATGERFALVKRRKPIRDKNGLLILPLISIRRTNIEQTSLDVVGRGINQHTGDLIIKRRLNVNDVDYQRIINKLGIKNQDSLATNPETDPNKKLQTKRTIGSLTEDIANIDGAQLAPAISSDNIVEFITIPQPQFYTANYEIVFTTQYTQHMNEIVQRLFASFLPQGRQLKLDTDKGYWFIAEFSEMVSANDNLDDFSENERVIMSTIGCKVYAYMLPGEVPGEESPFRKYISATEVTFEISDTLLCDTTAADPYQYADDPSKGFLIKDDLGNPFNSPDKKTIAFEQIRNPFTDKNDIRYLTLVKCDYTIGESIFTES